MKILLVGEYSNLHNSLKEGLQQLGHSVSINGLNDGFKNYAIDFKIPRKWNSKLGKKIKLFLYYLTGFDLTSYATYRQVKNNISKFSGYDVVQLINENSFLCSPYFEKKILELIFKNNTNVFLLSCGGDYINTNYYYNHQNELSVLTPYFEGKVTKKDFYPNLKYLEKNYIDLHRFIYQNIKGVIATDLDYHIPLVNHTAYLGLIPNPINTKKIKFISLNVNETITIFLGINTNSYTKKGIEYFEEALKIIKEKYKEKVNCIVTRNIPYHQYINHYNDCHILLDQLYAKDQGYNALEAMAKGKVVFTGAGEAFNSLYAIKNEVVIHAKPNIDDLVSKLSDLIDHPEKIKAISENARQFIEKNHECKSVAEKYVMTWCKKTKSF